MAAKAGNNKRFAKSKSTASKMAKTEWTTVERKKVWAAPMTSSGLRQEKPRLESCAVKPKEEFPALGGSAPQKKTTLNFKAMATDASARFARQEAEAAAEEAYRLAEQERMGRYVSQAELIHRSRLATIPTRCYDDGPDDYDPPEETDGYGFSTSYEYRDYEESAEADNSEEFNAHLAVDRRAGDKSNW